jgi:hypothetical protein
MRSLLVSFVAVAFFFSSVLAADKMPSQKTVKDGRVNVEGVVTSLADIERAAARVRMTASTGMAPVGIVTFRVTGTNGVQYACDIKDEDYPKALRVGDTLKLRGTGNHQESAGVADNYRIEKCKVTDRRAGLAKHVTLDGTIVEHKDFSAGTPHLGPADTFRRIGPSDTFRVNSDGKVYSCFVEGGNPEFRSYRQGDKITIAGVIADQDPLSVQGCRIESHEFVSYQ